MKKTTLAMMLFALLAPLSAQAIFVPDTSVTTIPDVATPLDVAVPNFMLEDPANFSCEAEVLTETAANGQNKAYMALSYIATEEVSSVSYDLVATVGDDTIMQFEGIGTLEVTGAENTNMFQDGPHNRKLLVISGTQIKEKLFPVYKGKQIMVTAQIDGNDCAPKSVFVIDDLSCSIDGQIELLDNGMNKLRFTTLVDVDADRDTVPFSLILKSESASILAEKGKTNLVSSGNVFVTKDGEATRYITIDPTEHDTVKLSAMLGGHTCSGMEIATIEKSSIVDIILGMDDPRDGLVRDTDRIPTPEIPEFVGEGEGPEEPAMEGDEIPAGEEGAADGEEGIPAEEGVVPAGGEVGDAPDMDEADEDVRIEDLTPELVEEILASADEDVDLTDREEVEAVVEAYFADLAAREDAIVEESDVKDTALVANDSDDNDSSTDNYLTTILYIAIAVFVIFIALFLALLLKGKNTETKEE